MEGDWGERWEGDKRGLRKGTVQIRLCPYKGSLPISLTCMGREEREEGGYMEGNTPSDVCINVCITLNLTKMYNYIAPIKVFTCSFGTRGSALSTQPS